MQSRFEQYLNACFSQAAIEAQNNILNTEIAQCTREAQMCIDILKGDQPQLGKAGRIFNNFPLDVKLHNEIYRAVDAYQLAKLTEATQELVSQLPDTIGMGDGEEDAKPRSQELIKPFNDLFARYIQIACKELLDHTGEIKAGVMQTLKLDQVFEKFLDEKATQAAIKDQLIYSFYSQILVSNFIEIFKKNPKLEHKLNEFNLLAQYGIFNDGKFGPTFYKEIRHFLFEHSVPSTENWIRYLKVFTPETITELVTRDFFNLNHAHISNEAVLKTLQTQRVDFWIEIMQRLQKEPDLLLQEKEAGLTAIYRVSRNIQKKWDELPDSLALEVVKVNAFAVAAPAAAASSSRADAVNDSDLEAMKWLNYRDNTAFLDFIMQDEIAQPSMASYLNPLRLFKASKPVMTEDQACKAHLNHFYQKEALLLLPTKDFFFQVCDTYERPEKIISFLEKYLLVDMELIQEDNPVYAEINRDDWFGLVLMLCKVKDIADLKLRDSDWDILKNNNPKLLAAFEKYVIEFDPASQAKLLTDVIAKQNSLGQLLEKILPAEQYNKTKEQLTQAKISVLYIQASSDSSSVSNRP